MMASPSPNTRGGLGIPTPRRILLRMYKCVNPAPFAPFEPRQLLEKPTYVFSRSFFWRSSRSRGKSIIDSRNRRQPS